METLTKTEWISVEDGLPEASGGIFPECSDGVLTFDGAIGIGYYNHDQKYWEDSEGYNLPITHWMPAPEPPNQQKP